MKWYCNKLFGVVVIGLLFMSMSATAADGASAVLYDGDARSFTDAPDTIAYANTEHTTPPSEFQITTSGATWPSGPIWRNYQWIALMDRGSWVEAKTTVASDTVGVQFWGDTNDGWARVLVDGSEVWTGNTYGSDVSYPGGAFVKYLEISGLSSSTHTIRVECMGISGSGGGDDVTIMFFGLEDEAETCVVLHDGDARSFADAPDVIAYANTEYTTPPSEFRITTSGSIWRYYQWIALMQEGSYVEARTTVATDTVGIQFWGDTNDGWARVLVDGSEVWTGNTYGSDVSYPGGAFVKYLEIGCLDSSTHTIRVECMGISGAGGGDDVTIMFFGLEGASSTTTPTASGLVAYYPFDGDAKDHSGNGNDGTNNGATFVSGISGKALDFDGTNDYVYAPVNINPNVMPQMTMTLWVRSDSNSQGTVISHDNGGFDRSIDIDSRGGGVGWSAFSGSGGVLGYKTVTTGKWTFLAVVYDQAAGTVKLYVDGTKYEESGSLSAGWDYTHIGSNPSFGSYFNGVIDEVRIYNYALTQSEINSLYEGETAPPEGEITPTPTATLTPESGLVAYYPFDGDAKDYSGNGNDGTNNGATFVSGISGKALDFDGTNDYVYVPVNINPDVMPQLTMTLWVRSDSNSQGTVISHDNGGFDRSIDIDSRGGGVGWSSFSGTGGVLGYQTVTTNKWTFLAVVYDQAAGTVKLYVDGTKYEESGSLSNGWDYTHIGSNPSFGSYFNGVIDEVRIYNYALTQSEINSLSEGETVPPAGEITPPSTAGFSGLIFESRAKSSGSSVQIPLTLKGIDENIGNMDITLAYDSSVLEATEVIKGGLTTDSLFDYNIVDGTIKISLADKQGFSGDGSIAYVRFDVIGAEGSSSPLEITKLSANRAEDLSVINIPAKDGVFKVVSREESLGDVDGDGTYTAVDALYALQMAVGKIPEDLIMDMNGDGQVSSIDARKILRIAAGLE